MTSFGWVLILIPFVAVGLVAWGMREDPAPPPAERPYDWEADRFLDLRGPMQ